MYHSTLCAAPPTAFCAGAAARAALVMLLSQKRLAAISLRHPDYSSYEFVPEDIFISVNSVSCMVSENCALNGDSFQRLPVRAEVSLKSRKGISIVAGPGIGRVVKKGINIPVGEAAVNYVSQRIVMCELEDVLDDYYCHKGACVKLSVPGGEDAGEESDQNDVIVRDGIAITECADKVKPYSVTGFKNSLRKTIDEAFTAGCRFPVLSVGSGVTLRGDGNNPMFRKCEVVPVHNLLGFGLRSAAQVFDTVLVAGHPERLFKVMLGCFNTHTQRSASPLPWVRDRIKTDSGFRLRDNWTGDKPVTDAVMTSLPGDQRRSFLSAIASDLEKKMRGYAREHCIVGTVLIDNNCNPIGIGKQAGRWKECGCL